MENWQRSISGAVGMGLSWALAVAAAAGLIEGVIGPTLAQGPAAPTRTTVVAQVDAFVRARLAHPQGPASISVTIVRNGETLVQQAWGTADAAANRPATAAMTYRIGSVSKQFTAALILKLVDRGKLSLRDTVGRTLGRHFKTLRLEWRPITVEQLLNHTSGLPRDYRLHALQALVAPTDEARLGWAARDPMIFAPGTRHVYSNTGYMLLGLLIEKLYDKSYADVVRDEIAGPLGLTSLAPCTAPEIQATAIMGHTRSPQGTLLPASELMFDVVLGGSGLCATAGDLARWNLALHGGRVLSKPSYAAMITPRGAAVSGNYGFGIRSLRMTWGAPVLTHDGTTIAFVSENSWFPAESLSVTVLYNSSAGPGTSPMAAHLARIAIGQTLAAVTQAVPARRGPAALVGFYEGRPGRGFDVTLEKGTLYAEPTDSTKQRLVLQSGTTYAIGGGSATMTFTVGADGRVTALVFRAGPREQTFPKVR